MNNYKLEVFSSDREVIECVFHVYDLITNKFPITTGYADKICKNLDYVPAGQVENKLFFL